MRAAAAVVVVVWVGTWQMAAVRGAAVAWTVQLEAEIGDTIKEDKQVIMTEGSSLSDEDQRRLT